MYERLLVLQLDSVPWSVLGPLMAEGAMPRLKALYEQGCSGTLCSTIPPITPAAWATFMTGVNPGRHGILGFKGFDPVKQTYRLSDARHLHERNIYRMLAQSGKRVGVMMQPSTHPPFDTNGFMLSGFDGPGLSAPFAFPSELEPEIRKLCPEHELNYNFHRIWNRPLGPDADAIFAANLAGASEQVRRVTQLTLDLLHRRPVDALIAYYQAPDVVLHKAWPFCLPSGAARNPARRAATVAFWREVDTACGRLLDEFPSENRLELVISDHGHQLAKYAVSVNDLLQQAGLLTFARSMGSLAKDAVRRVGALARGEKRRGLGTPIDWDRTKAFMPYQVCSGLVYVNLKGRQPYGSVDPADYVRVRDEVRASLLAQKLPDGNPVCEDVVVGDEFFPDKDARGMPDLILLQGEGVDFKRRAGQAETHRLYKMGIFGIHHPDGLYILRGAGVPKRTQVDFNILDFPPTLLAALGEAVPSFMEGAVRHECFEAPLDVRTREWPWGETAAIEAGYTPEQQAEIEARLEDLGYLD
ncbi:MAG: hypothetical protein AMXMBFR7_32120 [Planctomycetota bacterium]